MRLYHISNYIRCIDLDMQYENLDEINRILCHIESDNNVISFYFLDNYLHLTCAKVITHILKFS